MSAIVNGVWQPEEKRIVIKRSQLRSLRDYASTLLDELGHALSEAPDISRPFEDALTRLLGTVTDNARR